jgi:hypothetical protein
MANECTSFHSKFFLKTTFFHSNITPFAFVNLPFISEKFWINSQTENKLEMKIKYITEKIAWEVYFWSVVLFFF